MEGRMSVTQRPWIQSLLLPSQSCDLKWYVIFNSYTHFTEHEAVIVPLIGPECRTIKLFFWFFLTLAFHLQVAGEHNPAKYAYQNC